MPIRRPPLSAIRLEFQPHENLIAETVASYACRIQRRERIEPVLVCYDGVNFWLKDGFRRYQAAWDMDRKTIMAEIVPGTLADMEAEWQRYMTRLKSELQQKPAPKAAGKKD
jgi:hypothetical protein